MTQNEIRQFAINAKPKINDKIIRLLYSEDLESTKLACVTLLRKGKCFCEEHLNYATEQYLRLQWGDPILVIDRSTNMAILIIDWVESSGEFPKRTCHLMPKEFFQNMAGFVSYWNRETIIEI